MFKIKNSAKVGKHHFWLGSTEVEFFILDPLLQQKQSHDG